MRFFRHQAVRIKGNVALTAKAASATFLMAVKCQAR
jgi:hypothetical protein